MKKLSQKPKDKKHELPGYKPYPDEEDIYRQEEHTDIDPEKLAETSVKAESDSIVQVMKAQPNSKLDVPGEELDDESEITGSEDEENNYYSLGGEDHNDLDEDNSGKQ